MVTIIGDSRHKPNTGFKASGNVYQVKAFSEHTVMIQEQNINTHFTLFEKCTMGEVSILSLYVNNNCRLSSFVPIWCLQYLSILFPSMILKSVLMHIGTHPKDKDPSTINRR